MAEGPVPPARGRAAGLGRDLRKAYLRLIRSYKPEHSPEEFKRIREAYESTLPLAQHLDAIRDIGRATEGEADPPLPRPSRR